MNIKKIVGISLLGVGAAIAAPQAAPAKAAAPAAPAATPAAEAAAPVADAPVAEAAPAESAAAPADSAAAPVADAAPEAAAPVAEAPAPAPVAEAAPAEEPKAEQIAVPAAPVAQKQDAWFAEAAKAEPAAAESAAGSEAAPAKKNPFDVLHGTAYNTVGNEAAADNVTGLLARPDLFAGRQFMYIEPASEFGVFSFGSLFGALDISGNLGRGTIGYATSGFGIAAHAALGQFYFDGDEGTRYNTEAGDDLGLNASKVVGKYAIILNVDWNTYKSEVGVEPAYGSSSDENYRDLSGSLAVSNAPGASGTNWSLGVGFMRHENTTEVAGKVIDENADSYVKVAPFFNFGALGVKSERARLYAGVNASVPVYIHDEYEKNTKGKTVDQNLTEFGLDLVPNILGEVALTESALVFGEAAFDWVAYAYGGGNDENGNEYSVMQSQMNKVSATAGFRYQYEDIAAIEFAFGDSFFTDTKSIFNGQGVFVSFGGFILF